MESIASHYRIAPLDRFPPRIAHATRVALTFSLVTIGWVLFKYRIDDLAAFWQSAVRS
jgi:hypothetical protein